MAAIVDCGSPQSCCIHSLESNPIEKHSSGMSSLLSVSLEAVDMQSIDSEEHSGESRQSNYYLWTRFNHFFLLGSEEGTHCCHSSARGAQTNVG